MAGFLPTEVTSALRGRVCVSVPATGQPCGSDHRSPPPPNSSFPWVKVWGWNTFHAAPGSSSQVSSEECTGEALRMDARVSLCPHGGIWATPSLASPVTGPGRFFQAGAGTLPRRAGAHPSGGGKAPVQSCVAGGGKRSHCPSC